MTTKGGPRCVFHTKFIRTDVDPRVQELWPKRPVPFGDLRRTWRLQHCATVNPYGDSENCPYPTSDCALAFLATVQYAVANGDRNPMGLFRKVARSDGLRRLETKPLARDRRAEGPSLAGAGAGDPEPRPGRDAPGGDHDSADVRGAHHRPVSVGNVLGSLNLRPHPGRIRPDVEAGDQ